jgi:ubiquinone/menaquinone biosynthesis C-methylase UbiE
MDDRGDTPFPGFDDLLVHYDAGGEAARLSRGPGRLELARTQEIVTRYLPPPPAVVLDVGGGPGVYATWLARLGYEVHLVDAVARHVDEARRASAAQPDAPLASANVGDARSLEHDDRSADGVLLLGPLYHLVEAEDRAAALAEARRVLRPGAWLVAAGISRFASTLDGLWRGLLDDPEFERIAARDRADGQHRNPTNDPRYFTTAFFHHPDELRAEVEAAGFAAVAVLAAEGPGWLVPDFDGHWDDPARRTRLLDAVRAVEADPSMLGASAHLLATGQR